MEFHYNCTSVWFIEGVHIPYKQLDRLCVGRHRATHTSVPPIPSAWMVWIKMCLSSVRSQGIPDTWVDPAQPSRNCTQRTCPCTSPSVAPLKCQSVLYTHGFWTSKGRKTHVTSSKPPDIGKKTKNRRGQSNVML